MSLHGQVHLLFRHGDRTPIAAYPTDPYKDYPWPGGWGQLTLRGMRRHLALGRWIRCGVRMLAIAKYHTIRLITSGFRV